MYGNQEGSGMIRPLITVEELKVMKVLEAIALIPRMMPYKTTLLPDWKMNGNLEKKTVTFQWEIFPKLRFMKKRISFNEIKKIN